MHKKNIRYKVPNITSPLIRLTVQQDQVIHAKKYILCGLLDLNIELFLILITNDPDFIRLTDRPVLLQDDWFVYGKIGNAS